MLGRLICFWSRFQTSCVTASRHSFHWKLLFPVCVCLCVCVCVCVCVCETMKEIIEFAGPAGCDWLAGTTGLCFTANWPLLLEDEQSLCPAAMCAFLKAYVDFAGDAKGCFNSDQREDHWTQLRLINPHSLYFHKLHAYTLRKRGLAGKRQQHPALSPHPSICFVPLPSAPVCFPSPFSHVSLPASDRSGSHTSLFLSTANWLTLGASCITTHYHSLANMHFATDAIYQWQWQLKLSWF